MTMNFTLPWQGLQLLCYLSKYTRVSPPSEEEKQKWGGSALLDAEAVAEEVSAGADDVSGEPESRRHRVQLQVVNVEMFLKHIRSERVQRVISYVEMFLKQT